MSLHTTMSRFRRQPGHPISLLAPEWDPYCEDCCRVPLALRAELWAAFLGFPTKLTPTKIQNGTDEENGARRSVRYALFAVIGLLL